MNDFRKNISIVRILPDLGHGDVFEIVADDLLGALAFAGQGIGAPLAEPHAMTVTAAFKGELNEKLKLHKLRECMERLPYFTLFGPFFLL